MKNKDGNSAIHLAALGGHLDCIKLLLSSNSGIKIDYPGKNRMTPLMMAAKQGHFEIVKYLVENGAKIKQKDKFSKNALIYAT